eukprot:2285546-Prymnesium_polylepis.1
MGDYVILGEANGRLHAVTAETLQAFVAAPQSVGQALSGIDVGSDASPAFGDLTGDGLEDLMVGSAQGTIRVFPNVGNQTVARFGGSTNGIGEGAEVLGQEHSQSERTVPALGDFNGDAVADL